MSADVLILPIIRVERVDDKAPDGQIIQVTLSRGMFARLTAHANKLNMRQDEAAAALIERALDPKGRT